MVGEKIRLHRSRPCKRERGKTNIDSLPDELLLDILARLSDDPHYLYDKARVVCRRWCRLIHSHDFIKTQLHRSEYGLLLGLRDRAVFAAPTQGQIQISKISYKVPTNSRLRSSCNGLVLHQWRGLPVSVTNPVTRQQFALPSLPCQETDHQKIYYGCSIGYAADSMEYKVVLPYMTISTEMELINLAILSVGRDKSWRHVAVEHLSLRAVSILQEAPLMACTSEGFITWSSYEDGRYLKLDMETEILTLHPSPVPEGCLLGTRSFYLSTGRSLSLLVVHKYPKYLMELWEMKAETGEWRKVVGDIKLRARKRWFRRFAPSANARLKPLGWVRYPEVLALRFSQRSTCILFSLNTRQIAARALPKEVRYYYFHAHKKSLAWFTDDLHYKARVVCRRWRHLIHSDYFIKTQLHRSTYGLSFSLFDHPTFVPATQCRIETSKVSDKFPTYSRLRCSCNGLALQHYDGKPVSIINPVTGQQFDLPSLSCKQRIDLGGGIGYAVDSMDYKVAQPYVSVGDKVCLGILSVGRDKSWRHVAVEHLSVSARSHLHGYPLITEGFITWPKRYVGSYLTLDVEIEILTLHPSPVPEACLVGTYSVYLSTGRSLSLFVVHKKYLMEVWEMKAESGEWRKVVGDIKLGAHERWLQHFCNGGSGLLMPLGWVRYPEVLALYFRMRRSCCILFNLNTQQISAMKLSRRRQCQHTSAHAHKKSLTWFI